MKKSFLRRSLAVCLSIAMSMSSISVSAASMESDAITEETFFDSEEEPQSSETDIPMENYEEKQLSGVSSVETDFTYEELNGSYISITGYNGTETEIAIPNTIDGYTVQAISNNAFKGNRTLKKVSLNSDCERLGESVFEGCIALENIRFNDKILAIGAKDFYGCTALSQIEIPSTIKHIYGYAFGECSSLKNVKLPDSIEGIGYRAFYHCSLLETINYPLSWKTSYSYSYKDGEIFAECGKLNSITVPKGIADIAPYAFKGCKNLTSITIADTVTGIGEYAFEDCDGLTAIELPGTLKSIGAYAFSGCDSFVNITIPDTLISMGYRAFYNSKNLEKVNYPVSWKESPAYSYHNGYAFSSCPKLTEFVIPEGVTAVAPYAFSGCTSLKSVTMPGTLTTIGNDAFNECTGLSQVIVPDEVTEIGANAFCGCTGLRSVQLPKGLDNIYAYAFKGCAGLTKVELPDSVTKIGHNAFAECTSLKEINYPLSWNECPAYSYKQGRVFYGCSKLSKITIPEGVTSIPEYAFEDCGHLQNIIFASTVNEIGRASFKNCTGLTSIVLDEEMKQINQSAFEGCSGLESIWIGEKVASIHEKAFYGCEKTKLVIHGVESSGAQIWADKYGYTFSAEAINSDKVSINGTIMDSELVGIENVQIAVYDIKKHIMAGRVSSDNQGNWSYDEIIQGKDYKVTFYHPCYEFTPSAILINTDKNKKADTVHGKKITTEVPETSGDMFKYRVLNGSYISISGYAGDETEVVIPDQIDGYTVQTIGENAFKNNSTVKTIVLSDNIESIGESAFEGCTALKTIAFNGNLKRIDSKAFYKCASLDALRFPSALTRIYGFAFAECSSLKNVDFPDGIRGIGYRAFYHCSSLETIVYPLSWKETYSYSYKDGEIFAECGKLKSITVPEGITGIAPYAFKGCKNLTGIVIADSVTGIGEYAFEDCDGLTSIELPENLKSIGAYAFSGCDSFVSITIPDTLTSMGYRAFYNSKNLKRVNYPVSWKESPAYSYHNGYAFSSCPKLTEFVIPEGVKVVAPYAFSGCTSLKSVTMPDTLTTIGRDAFSECTGLSQIILPDKVTEVGVNAFCGCIGLKSIQLPEGLDNVYAYAFKGCTGLTKVELPDSITKIGHNAFAECTGLKEINYPLSWTECPSYSYRQGSIFYGCKNLTRLTIPEGVKSVPEYAFEDCGNLKTVIFASTVSEIGRWTFKNCTGLTSIVLNEEMKEIGQSAFEGCSGLESIWIGEKVTSIHEKAFLNCDKAKLVIHGVENSETQIWADKYGYTFSTEVINAKKVSVSGTIIDSKSAGIENVQIVIYDIKKQEIVSRMSSDDQGNWVCEDMDQGKDYKISYYHPYYEFVPAVTLINTNEDLKVDAIHGQRVVNEITETPGEKFTYKILNGSYISISGYTGEETEVVIPGQIDGYTVQAIGGNAFKNHSAIKTIVLPDNAESIGESAFEGCTALKTIVFNGSLKRIDSKAFYKCTSIDVLRLPNALNRIYGYSFAECSALKNVDFPDSVIGIGYRAFYSCASLETISYPLSWKETYSYSYKDGEIFAECGKLKSITVPEGITGIAPYAFKGCKNLTGIVIADSVTGIGEYAFEDCDGLTSIELPENLKSIGAYAFSGCDSFVSITIPDTLTSMGYRAFYNSKNLKRVNYPVSWKESPAYSYHNGYAFSSCPKLTEFVIPEGVKVVAPYAFSGCTSLKSVTMPDTLTTIGRDAFSECTGLSQIILPDKVTEVGVNAFCGCIGLKSIQLPEGLDNVYAYAFKGCTGLTKVELPDSITKIGHNAFAECTGLKEINYPLSWTECPSYSYKQGSVFYGCKNLRNLTIPEGVRSVPEYAFEQCRYLRNVILPATIEKIGRNAFYGCKGMPSLRLNDGIKEIGDSAFYECDGVLSVEIPGTIASIGKNVFGSCRNLQQVNVAGNCLNKINDSAFSDCSKLVSVYLPRSVKSINDNAFKNDSKLTFYCPYVSYATLYAIRNKIPFISSDTAFDDENSIVNRAKTYFYADVDGKAFNGYVKMALEYSINDSEGIYKNKKIQFYIPNNGEIKESTIKVGGVLCQNYKLQGNLLTIPVGNTEDSITFYVRPLDNETMMSYVQLFYDNGNDILGIINEKMTMLTLNCDDEVSTNTISVSGYGPKQAEIALYIDNTRVKDVTTSKTGKYSTVISLDSPQNDADYNIKAECMDNGKKHTAQSTVTYSENSPELKDLKLYYNSRETGIDLMNSSSTKTPYVSFNPGVPFTFTADFTNKDKIEDVYIVSTRNNVKKYMEAKYNSKKKIWVASGYFDDENHSYVPGKISVDINKKQDIPKINENYVFGTDNITNAMSKTVVTLGGGDFGGGGGSCRFDVTDTIADVADIGKELGKTYVDFNVSMFDDKTDSSLSEVVDFYKALKTASGYFIPDENGHNWFATADYSDPATWSLMFKDVSDSANKIVKFKLAIDSDEWTRLDEIAPYLGVAAKGFDAAHKIIGFKKDHKELREEIMMNSSITDKETALRKADSLFSDQANYTIMIALLPLLVKVGIGMTGPVAIGFTALCGIIGATSSFFWKARVSQITGQEYGVRWAIDPSGFVYEGVLNNRLPGVTVTAYYKEKLSDPDPVLWDAGEYDQENPLVTGNDGVYAWDVPEGFWQVKYEKEGYDTAFSEWMEVPPPQTDVNVKLTLLADLAVSSVDVYEDRTEVEFNQYVDPSKVNDIIIKDSSGTIVKYTLNYNSNETDSEGKVYAKTFQLVYKDGLVPEDAEVTVFMPDTIATADGKILKKSTIAKKCVKEMIITAPDSVSVEMGEEISIPISISNYRDGCVINAVSDAPAIAMVKKDIGIQDNTRGTILVTGELYGEANIRISCNNKDAAKIKIRVCDETSEHTHVPQKAVKENVNEAQCTKTGSYDSVIYCSECGEELSRETITVPAAGHSWNAGFSIDKPATATEPGSKSIHCSKCGEKKNITVIPSTGGRGTSSQNVDTILTDKTSNAKYTLIEKGNVEYNKPLNSKKTTITIPETIKVKGVRYKVVSIASNAFKNNKSLKTIVIGANIKKIGTNAFRNCTALSTVKGGRNVVKISKNGFCGCVKLKSVSIGKKVTDIGDGAFKGCKALTKVTIPVSVKKVGKSTFEKCRRLKKIVIKSTKLSSKSIGKNAFKNLSPRAAVKVPKKKLKAYKKILQKRGILGKKQKITK